MLRTARGRNRFKVKLKQQTVYSIGATMLFVLGGLVWLSFIRQGSLLVYINTQLLNTFGTLATFFLPFPFICGGLMLTKIKTSLAAPHTFLGSLIVLLVLVGLSSGGALGSGMWGAVASIISSFGAWLFFLGGLGIGLMVMFNIPLEEIWLLVSQFKLKAPTMPSLAKLKVSGMIPIPSSPATIPSVPMKVNNPSARPMSSGTLPLPKTANLGENMIWHYPELTLLTSGPGGKADRGDVNGNASIIEKTLEAFGITAKVVEVNLGPAVTQYALEVAIGTKLSKINALSNDLALALAAPTGQIRIEAPIPGRSLVGIELPNHAPEFVGLKKMLESDMMKHHKSKLAVALGLDVSGQPIVADIAKMPHVLIAGSTGSGKSVCINAFIASILFRASPSEVKFIMVDPKRVELTGYNGIPHLLSPVIVDPEKVLSALKWATTEMDHRYKMFAEVGARNIDAYNELSGFQALPYIVIIIDELADVMMFAQVEAEDAITRLAQMARATGIHLVLSTQRPSVNVITGLIKANVPTRISFAVSSMIDSRVIIDQPGAEKLLGRGDMLFIPPDQAKPTRIQGAFVSDKEIHALLDFLKKQGVAPAYTEEVTNQQIGKRGSSNTNAGDNDPLFADAVRLIVQNKNASASFLQRKMSVGYARAARILDELQQAGAVSAADGSKPRDILVHDVEAFLNPQTT